LRIFNVVPSALIVLLIVTSSCSPRSQARETGRVSFEKQELIIESRQGNIGITAELAITQEERQQGLMHRSKLDDGNGMLFIFQRDEVLHFYMKNTLIPLSIAFIASDGRIVEMFDMQPGNLNTVSSSRSLRYALEVPQGWFTRAGIARGDRLRIEDLR